MICFYERNFWPANNEAVDNWHLQLGESKRWMVHFCVWGGGGVHFGGMRVSYGRASSDPQQLPVLRGEISRSQTNVCSSFMAAFFVYQTSKDTGEMHGVRQAIAFFQSLATVSNDARVYASPTSPRWSESTATYAKQTHEPLPKAPFPCMSTASKS